VLIHSNLRYSSWKVTIFVVIAVGNGDDKLEKMVLTI